MVKETKCNTLKRVCNDLSNSIPLIPPPLGKGGVVALLWRIVGGVGCIIAS
jgi:hypothetical protein